LRPIDRESPLAPEIALDPCFRVGGDNGHEQPTVVNLFSDPAIPGVSAAQFLAVEPDLNSG
jgi:hypothetical protein